MAGGKDQGTCRHILADLDEVLPFGDGAEDFDLVVPGFLGTLHHDNGVGAFGNHAAGVDQGAFTFFEAEGGGCAHGDLPGELQIGRESFAGTVGIRSPDCITVHGAAHKGGKGLGGTDLPRTDPSQGLFKGEGFPAEGAGGKGGEQGLQGILRTVETKKLSHGLRPGACVLRAP